MRLSSWRGNTMKALRPSSFRILLAGSIGVVIWVIWINGVAGASRRVTMLALSEVSILGTGLVIALRRACRAEEAASQSERRYRFVSDYSFDMIVLFDPRTQRRTFISPACRRLYGYEPWEAMALPATQIIHPDDLSSVNAALSELEQHGDHPPILYRGRRKDGRYIWVEASLALLKHPESEATEIVSIVRDVSDRVHYEEGLRQAKEAADTANSAKSQFLATMSHELRTPLSAIIGFAELIEREVAGPIGDKRYRSYAGDIRESGRHLLQVINDILDLTRAESKKFDLHEEVIDIVEVVRSVVRMNQAEVERRCLLIKLDLLSELPLLRADERQTQQVLAKLIGNAVKFTPAGGHIEIGGQFDPEAGLQITVADNGIGIAAEDLPHVCEPFFQADSMLSREHDGPGVGLAAAKAMMERHRGSLDLISRTGRGTRATMTFPIDRVVDRGGGTVPAAA